MDEYLDHLLSSAAWPDVNEKGSSYWGCSESGQLDVPLLNSIGFDEDGKYSSPRSMINSNQNLEGLAAPDASAVPISGESDNGIMQELLSTQSQKDGQECSDSPSNGIANGGLEVRTIGLHRDMVIPNSGLVNLGSLVQLQGVGVGNMERSSLSFTEPGYVGCSDNEPSEFHGSLRDMQTLASIPQLWHPPSHDDFSSQSPAVGEDRMQGFDLHQKHVNDDTDFMRNGYAVLDKALQYDNLSSSVARKGDQEQHTNFLPSFAAGPQISVASAGLNSLPQTTTISGSCNGTAKPRTRARRGQATDPHSIAERLRRERIAERMRNLQELVPNSSKTDKASMLDEILDYVKFLQLQVKVLSMSRLGAAGAVVPLITESQSEGSNSLSLSPSANREGNSLSQDQVASEQEIVKLMESSVTMAMQYLQSKGLCLMPIALATAISNAKTSSSSSIVSEEERVIKVGSTENNISSSNSSSSFPDIGTQQASSDGMNVTAKIGMEGVVCAASGSCRSIKEEESGELKPKT